MTTAQRQSVRLCRESYEALSVRQQLREAATAEFRIAQLDDRFRRARADAARDEARRLRMAN